MRRVTLPFFIAEPLGTIDGHLRHNWGLHKNLLDFSNFVFK